VAMRPVSQARLAQNPIQRVYPRTVNDAGRRISS
jgi:hypothetical protein